MRSNEVTPSSGSIAKFQVQLSHVIALNAAISNSWLERMCFLTV